MFRLTVLAVLICALLVGLVPVANADAWIRWKDNSTQQYMQVVEVVNPVPSLEAYVWQFGNEFTAPQFLPNDLGGTSHDCDWPERLRVVGGGSGAWATGDPSIPLYVRLVANVKNIGTEDWTDFHLRAISGCSIYNKYVSEYGAWSRYWNYDGTLGTQGWDYVMDEYYDPSWGMPEYGPVSTGQYFSFETWIQVTDPNGNFEVEFWPTAVVPEPSALLGLGMGLAGLMGHILRRKSVR